MTNLSYRIEGLEQVLAEIQKRRLNARRSIRQILSPGADIIRQEMRQRAKGRFKTKIARRISINLSKLEAYAEIGPFKKVAYIARFLEFGTKPHLIRARRSRMLRLRNGRLVRQVRHPGSRPYPFLQPAFDASKDKAAAAIAAAAKKILET